MFTVITDMLIVAMTVALGTSTVYLCYKCSLSKYKRKIMESDIKATSINNPGYSKDVLDFIQDLVSRIGLIEFKKMIDANDITKIHMNSMKPVVEKTANRTFQAVKDQLDDKLGLITKEFIADYIVDMSELTIKGLLNKQINVETKNYYEGGNINGR